MVHNNRVASATVSARLVIEVVPDLHKRGVDRKRDEKEFAGQPECDGSQAD